MLYQRAIGRLSVSVSSDGGKMHDYGHGCTVACVAGWNDSCPTVEHTVSVEELRDLRYLLDRAISLMRRAALSRDDRTDDCLNSGGCLNQITRRQRAVGS